MAPAIIGTPGTLRGVEGQPTVGIVATATLASFTGVDTLATPIYIGVNTGDHVAIFGGALLVALLALIADLVLVGVQRLVVSPGLRPSKTVGG